MNLKAVERFCSSTQGEDDAQTHRKQEAPVLLSTPPKEGAGQEAEEGFLTAEACQLKKKM